MKPLRNGEIITPDKTPLARVPLPPRVFNPRARARRRALCFRFYSICLVFPAAPRGGTLSTTRTSSPDRCHVSTGEISELTSQRDNTTAQDTCLRILRKQQPFLPLYACVALSLLSLRPSLFLSCDSVATKRIHYVRRWLNNNIFAGISRRNSS